MFVPILFLGALVFTVVGFWLMFDKAGQPGWASLIPFYNFYVMTKIAKLPGYYTALAFVPLVQIYAFWQIYSRIGRNFGKGAGFGLGMLFFTPIFVCILGFGDSNYQDESSPPPLRPQKVA